MRIKKFSAAVLALLMAFPFTLPAFAETTQSMDAGQAEAMAELIPSDWAFWDVQMAYTYGFVDTYGMSGFRKPADAATLTEIQSVIAEDLGAGDDTPIAADEAVTRGVLISELYDSLSPVLDLQSPVAKSSEEIAFDYFVDNGLVNGRGSAGYALDQACTHEEMLVLSVRAYEHAVYALGKDSTGLFWKATDGDSTVYLVGAVHLSDGSIFPMNEPIEAAFTTSAALVVEANILQPAATNADAMNLYAMLPEGETIRNLLDAETYAKYTAAMEQIGIPAETYDRMKPWYAGLVLSSSGIETVGYDKMGVDSAFLLQAMISGKPIVELEGGLFQFQLLDSFSDELDEAQLMSALEPGASTSSAAVVVELVELWKKGDAETMEQLVLTPSDGSALTDEYIEKMWTNRNRDMSEKITGMLQETGTDYFVVVGAGHMLGDTGIVETLRAEGYSVERVK